MGFTTEVLADTPRTGVTRVFTINRETSSYHSTDIEHGAIIFDTRGVYSADDYQTYMAHHAYDHDVAVNRAITEHQHSLMGIKVPDWLRRHATFMYQEGYTCTAPDMLFDWFREYHPNAGVARSDCSEFIRRFA